MLYPFFASVFQQSDGADQTLALVMTACMFIVWLVLVVILIVGFWKVFTKAGYPGWASLIPIYNVYVVLQMVGRPGWWLVLLLIPFVNIVAWIIVCMDIAKSFGKDPIVYGIILLFLLNGIGFLVLGFGDAEYQGPSVV